MDELLGTLKTSSIFCTVKLYRLCTMFRYALTHLPCKSLNARNVIAQMRRLGFHLTMTRCPRSTFEHPLLGDALLSLMGSKAFSGIDSAAVDSADCELIGSPGVLRRN